MAQLTEAKKDAAVQQPPPLRLSRVFHARRETVFKAWSSTEHVKRWFSPETFTVSDAKVQMQVRRRGALDPRHVHREEIEAVNRQFAQVETIKDFRLIEQILTPEDEELTPTMKLRRSLVSRKYRELIEGMYAQGLNTAR